ncbi:MAG TPA: hypothetical protein DEB06_09900 [Phycisphaerales bacterium]|nr:hypothetical protein [Phycisphaerales bacterium]
MVAAVTAAFRLPGLLSITTDNAQQQIEVTVGPTPGEVRVSGVSTIPSDFVFTDVTAIELTTGSANDFVEFRLQAPILPTVSIDTRGGESDVKVIYQINATPEFVASSVSVLGGPVLDKVAFEVFSEAAGFSADWSVNHGAGNNEASANVQQNAASELLSLNFNGAFDRGTDKVAFSVISNAAVSSVNLGGTMGAGHDSALLVIETLSPAMNSASFNLDLGGGNDVAETLFVSRGGVFNTAGWISGGFGLDSIKLNLEGDGRIDTQFAGGGGADVLDMALKGAIDGLPRLLGDGGNDILKLVVDGPRLVTPFIDGGAGFDEAIGFGTIINVEKIN